MIHLMCIMMLVPKIILFLVTITSCVINKESEAVRLQSVLEDPEISKFVDLITPILSAVNAYDVTIFAPVNSAFQDVEITNEDVVLYHVMIGSKSTDRMHFSSNGLSLITGGLPLYITVNSPEDIYVNNAKILINSSNIRTVNEFGKHQVWHKIDSVLHPHPQAVETSRVYNFTAMNFLENLQDQFNTTKFFNKVTAKRRGRRSLFDARGYHTFFIPVDDNFNEQYDIFLNADMIDCHVVLNKVLFTEPSTKITRSYTAKITDNDNIVVELFLNQEIIEPNDLVNFVESRVLLGASRYTQGVVVSKIIHPNIPVDNGVVHLIHKPLVIVFENVAELLFGDLKNIGLLNKFASKIKEFGFLDSFIGNISNARDMTLFAPINSAWDKHLGINNPDVSSEYFRRIINSHLVTSKRLFSYKIVNYNITTSIQSSDPSTRLYFRSNFMSTNESFRVQAGSVDSSIIFADIACKNGIIHIIDTVLGIPYLTVLEVLRSDFNIRTTYNYLNDVNSSVYHYLDDVNNKVTILVPSNEAWDSLISEHPTIRDKLLHGSDGDLMEALYRHILIDEREALTIEDMTNKPLDFKTPAGNMSFYVDNIGDDTYAIYWNNIVIPVEKSNIECINGMIHIIKKPLISEQDLTDV